MHRHHMPIGAIMFTFFERLIDPWPGDVPQAPPRGLIRFCWHYTRPVWPSFAIVSVLGAVLAVMEVMIFGFFGDIVDWLADQDQATFWQRQGGILALMAAFVVIALPAVSLLWELLFHQSLMGNYPMQIRWQAHRYLLRQSVGFYNDDFAGRIATKLMQTALAVREVVTHVLDVFVYVLVYFVGASILVAAADISLLLPMIGWFVLYCVIMVVFVPPLRDISKRQADTRSIMTGHVVDAYTNIATVKLFSHAEREEEHARRSMDAFLKTVYRQMRLVTMVNVSLHVINSLLLFAIAGIGLWQWSGGFLSIGELSVGVALVLRLQGMSQWILWEIGSLFENVGTVQDGINTLSRARAVVDAPGAKPLVVTRSAISIRDVKFHYGKETGVINRLSLDIAPGERVGLVGPSGAGKSTLVNLLLRFYDLEDGCITIDDQDIAQVTQNSLRANIGVVTQDTSLLHRSVYENIVYGRPGATVQEIRKAATQARAMDFIPSLVDGAGRTGLDAHVGERGVKLSGGQRQRIAIARVLLKDAPILILDEATSALDSEIEAVIQQSLFQLMNNKTVIAIAHRLSTIAAMDRLVVMDDGDIVEFGSHRELLDANGLYARMWQRQSGGFINAAHSAEAERHA